MGKYSAPDRIRAMKPEGTMVKAIAGHWYVNEYENMVEDGRRHTRMGPFFGSITEESGIVPNRAYFEVRSEDHPC